MIYAVKSDIGSRQNNEDFYFVPQRGEASFVVIADGMGGHKAGGKASSMAVEEVCATLKKGGMLHASALVENAVQTANKHIYEYSKQHQECRGMGTTLTLALLKKSSFIAANVGDSRLYHYSNGILKQVTRDHSVVAELVASGKITSEQAKHHPNHNAVTRALGVREVERVDIFHHEWAEGDILLLCTDGFYNGVTEAIVERILHDETDLQLACEKLVTIASRMESADNVSLILVKNQEDNA